MGLISCIVYIYAIIIFSFDVHHASVLEGNAKVFESLINEYEVTLIKFGATWCYYSQILGPVFDQLSHEVEKLTQTKAFALISIDCDVEVSLCTNHNINKYPTLKITKYGKILRHEFRGSRNFEQLLKFIKENLITDIPILDGNQLTPIKFLQQFNSSRNTIIGLFGRSRSVDVANDNNIATLKKVALIDSDLCDFKLVQNLDTEFDQIAYYDSLAAKASYSSYKFKDINHLRQWVTDQCTSLVRELNYANAEEITEEKLPLLLLFYSSKDASLKSKFTQFVKTHLARYRDTVNFLVADGELFSHPLVHLGKSVNDLPLICLDSFAHMYILQKSVDEALRNPSYLIQFIEDYKSNKLHMEYHYGPQSTSTTAESEPVHPESDKKDNTGAKPSETTPPESVFRRLMPSKLHYTILRDEL